MFVIRPDILAVENGYSCRNRGRNTGRGEHDRTGRGQWIRNASFRTGPGFQPQRGAYWAGTTPKTSSESGKRGIAGRHGGYWPGRSGPSTDGRRVAPELVRRTANLLRPVKPRTEINLVSITI